MELLLVGEVLGGGESQSGRDNTLDGRVISQVHEEADAVHGAVDLEVLLEEAGGLKVDTHGSEDDAEILGVVVEHILALDEVGLATDLGTDLVVGQTGSGEERDLLATGNGGHGVDGGDARLDHLSGVGTLVRINRLAL